MMFRVCVGTETYVQGLEKRFDMSREDWEVSRVSAVRKPSEASGSRKQFFH